MSSGLRRIVGRVLLALLLAWSLAIAARADDADPREALKHRRDELFQQVLANPSNLDVVFAYADICAQLGDNEGAVSALEQMLLFNPNLPRVDLELGALYFRMGSFEVAQTYFEKATAQHPPPEVQERIDKYVALIDKETSLTRLTGYVFLGAQYQSDANIAPGSAMIVSPIGPILLNQQFVKEADFNIFANASVLYTYDLGNQDRDTIEVTGNGLVNHYMKVGRLDLDFGEVTAGPRLHYPGVPEDVAAAVTLKPYAILNEVGLGEQQYFDTYGAGLEATGVVWGNLALRSAFEFRQKTFSNAANRPLTSGLTGNDKLVSLQATRPFDANSALTLEFDYVDQQTSFNYYTNQSYAGAVTYHIRYHGPPGALSELPMETNFYVSRLYSIYAAPDPCCVTGPGGFSSRDDRRWRMGLIQGINVTQNLELILQVERQVVSSNLSLYGYTSNSVVLGPEIKF
jgi:hypothetical protein